jgi:hypothetical protein
MFEIAVHEIVFYFLIKQRQEIASLFAKQRGGC